MSGTTGAVALVISQPFDRVWHVGLPYRLKSHGISGWLFRLILCFHIDGRLLVVLDGKSLHKYPVKAGVPEGTILGPALFLPMFENSCGLNHEI